MQQGEIQCLEFNKKNYQACKEGGRDVPGLKKK